MKYHRLSIIVLSAYLCITACSDMAIKTREHEDNKAIVQSELLDYFYFKTGSYWIYKEKESDTRDSVWVYADQLTFEDNPEQTRNGSIYFQEGFSHLKDVYYADRGKSDGFILRYFSSDNVAGKHQSLLKEMRDGKAFYDRQAIRAECRDNTFTKLNDKSNLQYIKLAELQIQGTTYRDVICIQSKNPADWNKKSYYARHVGLVSMEMEDGKTWELMSSEVKQ